MRARVCACVRASACVCMFEAVTGDMRSCACQTCEPYLHHEHILLVTSFITFTEADECVNTTDGKDRSGREASGTVKEGL